MNRAQQISMTSVATTALWICCLLIGIIGVLIPYHRAQLAAAKLPPLQAELINVSLTADPIPNPDPNPAPAPEKIAIPPAAKLTLSAAKPLTPVAAPSAAIAFELPVAGPTRIVEAKFAAHAIPSEPAKDANVLPPVTQLTYGSGEGKQPAPTYPARALNEGQEGTVRIEFTVGADGRALAAEIVSRSPWPLLNDAALKVIRERWRFAPGAIRRYEVPIHFRLKK